MDIIPQKTCHYCKKQFPATAEYFRINRTKKSGFEARCKTCHKIRAIPLPPVQDGYKRCTKCKHVFPATLDYFHCDKASKDGFTFRCKQCGNDRKHNEGHQERHRKYGQKCYYAHREQNIARNTVYMSNLRLNNPEKAKMMDRVKRENRRARKQGSEGSYTQKDIQQIFAQQQGTCAYCHQQLTEYHIDHVVPLSRGGTNWPDNLALACPACNRSKGAKLLSEWLPNRH